MILAIDTAGAKIALCLFWPRKITKVYIGKSEQKADDLLLAIDKILSQNQVKLDKLKAIAVNQGPGSFTGLRVGISVANALAYSLKIPVIGVTLPAIASAQALAGGRGNQNNILKIAELGYKKHNSKRSNKKIILPFYGEEIR